MKIEKYTNIVSGETLYSSHPPEIKPIDGKTFILLAYTKNMGRTFWYNKEAVKLDRIEESHNVSH